MDEDLKREEFAQCRLKAEPSISAAERFDVLSGKRFELHRGRLTAGVPPEGVGFTVETPEAEVVDFGTEFSIDVESGTSEVHEFDGLVRVQPRSKKF